MTTNSPQTHPTTRPEWLKLVKQYATSDDHRSTRQILVTVIPFITILVLMYFSLRVSYLLTLFLGVLNAGFITRIFIIQHDCGHNSFYNSKKANNIIGSIFGVITLTPYHYWRRNHAKHHASAGNLDSRGVGDVFTMTVSEYQTLNKWGRFKYRFYRHPLTLFVIGPIAVFFISHRLPLNVTRNEKVERASIHWTNLALAVLIVGFGLWIGFKELLMITIPMYLFTFSVGVYLFYVQHQFENTYWRRQEDWDYFQSAIEGASFFKLPKILQWFSGNIGYHHIHHLSPRIPNYYLETAYRENPAFQQAKTLTILSSLKSVSLKLWDEQREKLISFSEFRKFYLSGAALG